MVVLSARQELMDLLDRHGAEYRLMAHRPEGRTAAASALRGHPLQEAAKCIVLRVNAGSDASRYVLAVIPGDRRVDLNAIKSLFGASSVGFAETEIAERLAGSPSGSVLPFALDPSLELIVDPDLLEATTLYFNAARLDQSIRLSADDYRRIAHPRVEPIAE
jgi:Ala-tRNA(Pro) deacylase